VHCLRFSARKGKREKENEQKWAVLQIGGGEGDGSLRYSWPVKELPSKDT